ncbi:MAG: hypothetical protein HYS19_01050 [Nitrosomonadales bacterium]|nr:hypothetical protein [Nitrosomonadales bacterium]
MNKNRFKYDLAYGCFLFCGASALVIGVMGAIPMDSGASGGLGFLVAIPLALAFITALVVGIVLSLLLWRHWPLLLLVAMTIFFVAEIVTEAGNAAFYNAAPFLYGIGSLAICGIWFFVVRGKAFPTPDAE